MPSLSADLGFRGLVHQVTDRAVLQRLDRGGVVTYSGFDPSAPSLHVGSLVQLCTLRRLQLAGNPPIALSGGATGMIGDPGGKVSERQLLSAEELASNVEGIRPQLEHFLDFSPSAGAARAVLVDNGDWLGAISMVDFLRDVGKHFTVNQMVAKESVRSRFEREDQGISYTEFSYMLLQAYDFLRLHEDRGCTLQVGGSDQWGNITMGVELVRKVTRDAVHGLTTPLVTKSDGTKFGKTESGTVWLDPARTSPYRLYQFFLQSEDAVVGEHLRLFTFLPRDEIESLDELTATSPARRAAQRALATEVCALVHGRDEASGAERASAALFGEEIATLDEKTLLDVVEEAPSSVVPRSVLDGGEGAGTGWSLVEALVGAGLVRSRSDARRAISQGGVYVNNVRETELERGLTAADLLHDRYVVLRKGRRDYHLVRVE
ncbi:MAG TPA: tyrosine--tRNA ligase [Acidimicrobiales bacterium]|nr:tyrosine--tRNA ligase [Acidimicrobiales bacterium]